MFKLFFLLLIISFCSAFDFIFQPGPLVPASKGEIWPKPQHENKLDDGFFSLLPTFFHFNPIGNICNTLTEALDRYRKLIIFNNRRIKEVYYKARSCYEGGDQNFLGYLTSVEVELTGACNDEEYPSFEMKEEYVVNVTSTVQRISSDTIWGILRGLETFSQLIYLTDDYSCHRIGTTSIHDYPRFAHRGLLLDTSRHYIPKEHILKLIETMSYNKLNVFHWHITDDYSFPYVSKAFPQMSNKGAFHPTLMIYEQDFVSEVQEYARKRGIRVLAEFDTPGHTLSWGLGNPDLLTDCHNVPQLKWGPINPIKNTTYDFIFKLFEEIKSVFKDEYTHLGGDEVDFSCWKSNPEINQWMAEHQMEGDYVALQSHYIQKLINHVDSLGLNSIVWEEVFTNGVQLPKSTVVNVWISDDPKTTLKQVTEAGHPTIISSYWYLDILKTGGDWLKFYNADPQDFDGTDEQKRLVLGGEACMWSEVVDEYNLEPRVWPRASVAAERFWSPPDTPKSAQNLGELWTIASRLQEQTCRMNRRGVAAQPPSGPSVCF
ncbi:putative beta-hexosaminidase fdl-like Protein [Tribolium castaneum]|uniref:Beta-hexosaminidase n=3 Tax=Tribolium castaneum TaxID=7070 RepID=D6WRR8_TRICA|nr:putative beta-hexosaminidase fdl-like Protein [Tribolium castaneum]